MGVAMKASENERKTAATSRRKDRFCFAMLLLLLDVKGRKRGFDQGAGTVVCGGPTLV